MSSHATSSRPRPSNPRPVAQAEEELYSAIARLSLHDLDELESRQRRQGSQATDTELALRLAREEVEALQQFQVDRALARSLSTNGLGMNNMDQAATPRTVRVNNHMPQFVTSVRPTPVVHNAASTPANPWATQLERTRRTAPSPSGGGGWWSTLVSWFSAPSPVEVSGTTSNLRKASSSLSPRPTGHTCVICQDPIRGHEVHAPCGHYYDRGCIIELFEAATRDETLYPPRCCRLEIPIARVQPLMAPSSIKTFTEKAKEFGTLKRVYCSNPRCSVFLGPQAEGGSWWIIPPIFTCKASNCGTSTCSHCKSRITSGVPHICQKDQKDEDVLRLGEQSQWARCPGCDSLVELSVGCFHMTCRCKTEFCYLCKAKWKTCLCVQWDERRLLVAAEARVDARMGVRPAAPAARDVRGARLVNPVNRPQVVVTRAVPPAPAPVPARRVNPLRTTAYPEDDLWDQPPPLEDTTPTTRTLERPRVTTFTTDRWWNDVPELEDTTLTTQPRPLGSTSAASSSRTTLDPYKAKSGGHTHKSALQGTAHNDKKPQYTRKDKGKGKDISERDRLVREAMEELRVNHDCSHRDWQYRRGGGRCQHCHHDLPLYLFRCRGCQTLACNRCRRNRL